MDLKKDDSPTKNSVPHIDRFIGKYTSDVSGMFETKY